MKIKKQTKKTAITIVGILGAFVLGAMQLNVRNIIVILCFAGLIGLSLFEEK